MKSHGQAKLTQSMHMVANCATFTSLKNMPFDPVFGVPGSTRSNVIGPYDLDKPADLPTMSLSDKKLYYGSRYVLAGGRAQTDSDDDTESDNDQAAEAHDAEAEPADPPICWPVLPINIILAVMKAYNVKHVRDLAPTPLNLAFKVVSMGASYVALCASQKMADYLKNQLAEALKQK